MLMGFVTAPSSAEELGSWSGYFINGGDINSYDLGTMVVSQDSAVTLDITVDSTLTNQFTSVRVLDASMESIDYTIIWETHESLVVHLTPGSYTVRIGRGLNNKYGNYLIEANALPANGGATETEINDTTANASTHPDNLFAGSIGHWRAKDVKDLADYYRFSIPADGHLHVDITSADTLVDFDTILSLRNSDNTQLNYYLFLSATSKTWDLHLAPGVYYFRVYTHDYSRYGAYTITTDFTPATTASSEIEVNDTYAAANPIQNLTLYGSVGHYRGKDLSDNDDWDNDDYFSCQVLDDGTLSLEVLSDESLRGFSTVFSIRNAGNTQLNYDWATASPKTLTIDGLDAGTYYIRFYSSKHGAYQINISGDVLLPPPCFGPGTVYSPLLLTP
jgi:hypothetical protein